MYKIQKKRYGYHLTFGGTIGSAEMEKWVEESKKVLGSGPEEFGVFVDMRTLAPLMPDVQGTMQFGQAMYKQHGMTRSVVILNDAILAMQFKRIAKESGIYEWERYIVASTEPDWEKKGEDWVVHAIDPDV